MILAAGERLSALVVAQRLRSIGINANPIGAEDIGLKLKGAGKAKEIDIDESKKSLDFDMLKGVPILTGWFGQGTDGELCTITGGSDHSSRRLCKSFRCKEINPVEGC